MSRRNSIVGQSPDTGPKTSLDRRRSSLADIHSTKKKMTISSKPAAYGRRASVAAVTRRASVSVTSFPATRRASFAGLSNSNGGQPPVSVLPSDLRYVLEGECFDNVSEVSDYSASTSCSRKTSSTSVTISDSNGSRQDEKEKEIEPSAEEKKEAFRNFLNERDIMTGANCGAGDDHTSGTPALNFCSCEALKSVFDLIMVNDAININIDNVFPLMKTLELDTKDDAILDMVRTACIETFGDIDGKEFDTAVLDLRKRTVGDEFEDDLRSAFNLIDHDEDGFITTSDIYQLMMGLGEMLTDYELDDLVRAADVDRDGKLSYKDFKLFLVDEWTDEDEIRENGIKEEENTEESSDNQATEDKAKETPEGEGPTETVGGGDKDGEERKDSDDKAEEQKVEEVRKPPPRARNSLLWGYMNTQADTKKNEEIINFVNKVNEEKETKSNDDISLSKDEVASESKTKDISENSPDSNEVTQENEVGTSKENTDKILGESENRSTVDNDPDKPKVEVPQQQEQDGDDLKPETDVNEITENKDVENTIKDDKDKDVSDDIDDSVEETEDTQSVISVTVKHLDSILEEGEDEHRQRQTSTAHPENNRKSQIHRQSSSASLRMRPDSAMTGSSADGFGDDSGIDCVDGEDVFDESNNDVEVCRTSSAKSRATSAKSRGYHSQDSQSQNVIDDELPKEGISDSDVNQVGRNSVNSQLTLDESDVDRKDLSKIKSHRLHLCTENNGMISPYEGKRESEMEFDDEEVYNYEQQVLKEDTERKRSGSARKRLHTDEPQVDKKDTERHRPGSARKGLHVQNLMVDNMYSEVGVTGNSMGDHVYSEVGVARNSVGDHVYSEVGVARNSMGDHVYSEVGVAENIKVDHRYCDGATTEEHDADKMILLYNPASGCSFSHQLENGIKSVTNKSQNKTPRQLVRTTSADRFKTIKQLENHILRHKTHTDHDINKQTIVTSNTKVEQKRNPNGLRCSHIDLDLNVGDEPEVGQNFRASAPIRRPRTAITFNEARRRAADKSRQEDYNCKYDSGIDSPDTDEDKGLRVVDLSKSFNAQFGELEAPNQSHQHHGYKSVWPLARVMAAYKNKYNDGKSLRLNSISRRLERREIPVCWSERESADIKFREESENVTVKVKQRPQTARGHTVPRHTSSVRRFSTNSPPETVQYSYNRNSNGGVITLSLPFQTDSKTRYKRMSPYSSYGLQRRETR